MPFTWPRNDGGAPPSPQQLRLPLCSFRQQQERPPLRLHTRPLHSHPPAQPRFRSRRQLAWPVWSWSHDGVGYQQRAGESKGRVGASKRQVRLLASGPLACAPAPSMRLLSVVLTGRSWLGPRNSVIARSCWTGHGGVPLRTDTGSGVCHDYARWMVTPPSRVQASVRTVGPPSGDRPQGAGREEDGPPHGRGPRRVGEAVIGSARDPASDRDHAQQCQPFPIG
jgi:hypothetical protein